MIQSEVCDHECAVIDVIQIAISQDGQCKIMIDTDEESEIMKRDVESSRKQKKT